MITYEEIKNDPYIVDMYNRIEKLGVNELWATHGWSHILKVVNTVEVVLKKLEYDKETIEIGKIAALLHDIGCIKGKENHANESYNIVSKYLADKDLSDENKSVILNAILNHGGSKNVTNIIEAVLVFADKIDYDKDRLLPLGYSVEGFNQIQHIVRINVDISKDTLIVRFITNDVFDKVSLEQYYFTPKIFKAIYNFSEYVHLKPCIKLNDIGWTLE